MKCFQALFLVLIFLCGCTATTKNPDFSYTRQSNKGLMAFSHPNIVFGSFLYLKKLDMKTNRLESELITLSMCSLCIPSANTFTLESSPNPEFYFHHLPEGTYALIAMRIRKNHFISYCQGTPAFEIKAGKINMIDLKNGIRPSKGSLGRLQTIVSQFPAIDADVEYAKIPAVITFGSKSQNGETCEDYIPIEGSFTVNNPKSYPKFKNQIR